MESKRGKLREPVGVRRGTRNANKTGRKKLKGDESGPLPSCILKLSGRLENVQEKPDKESPGGGSEKGFCTADWERDVQRSQGAK